MQTSSRTRSRYLIASVCYALFLTSIVNAQPPATTEVIGTGAVDTSEESEEHGLEAPTRTDVPDNIQDPAFERFVDISLVGKALQTRNIELLTDLTLQLAHGERVLFRSHKSGVTSRLLLEKAIVLVAGKPEANMMKRLAEAAKSLRHEELITRLEDLKKLGGASRTGAPDLLISLEKTDAATFSQIKALIECVEEAELIGDLKLLDSLETEIAEAKEFPESIRLGMQKLVKNTRERAATNRRPENGQLARLIAHSRQSIFEQVREAAEGAARKVDPTNPQGTAGHVADQIQGNRSVKIYFKNNTRHTLSIAWSLRPSSGTWYPNNTIWGWAIVPSGTTRYAGNSWGKNVYWCAVATTHRNPNLNKPIWWSGPVMRGFTIRTLKTEGFRYEDLGNSWRRLDSYTFNLTSRN